jgi:hypothetical protein
LNDLPVLLWPIAWSPDGRYIAAAKKEPNDNSDIYLLPADGGNHGRSHSLAWRVTLLHFPQTAVDWRTCPARERWMSSTSTPD